MDIKEDSLIICCVLNPSVILRTALLEEHDLLRVSSSAKAVCWRGCTSSRCAHAAAVQTGSEMLAVVIIMIILLMKTSQDAINN